MVEHSKVATQFSSPTRYLTFFIISLLLVGGLVFLMRDGILTRFFDPENRVINGFILTVLAIGIGLLLIEISSLSRQVRWLERIQQSVHADGTVARSLLDELPGQLLAPVKSLFADDSSGVISAQSTTAVIDAVSGRIEERRELSRWIIQALIITGLIGTFWGLFGTIGGIGEVIGSLQGATSGESSAAQGFGQLINDLKPVLASMSIAFSSSLLGLSGSLLLGFLELQTGAAHSRFVEELEDWLYSITRMRSASAFSQEDGTFDSGAAVRETIQLLDSVAQSMDRLRSSIIRSEEDRAITNRNIVALGERLRDLTEKHAADQTHLAVLSQNAANFSPLIDKMSQQIEVLNTKSQSDAQLAAELKDAVNRDQTAQQLSYLSQELQRLGASIEGQGVEIARAVNQGAEVTSSRFEQAILAATASEHNDQ